MAPFTESVRNPRTGARSSQASEHLEEAHRSVSLEVDPCQTRLRVLPGPPSSVPSVCQTHTHTFFRTPPSCVQAPPCCFQAPGIPYRPYSGP
eukprot:1534298-Alexandrium_andersonii.AAC.1